MFTFPKVCWNMSSVDTFSKKLGWREEGRKGFPRSVQRSYMVCVRYHPNCVKKEFYYGRNGIDSKILST